MIDCMQAVRRSIDYLRELQSLAEEELRGLEVEEVEKSREGHWLITLSHFSASDLGVVARQPRERSYKAFRVNAGTGEVESMSMRDVHAS